VWSRIKGQQQGCYAHSLCSSRCVTNR
jgi:hypothetical protein